MSTRFTNINVFILAMLLLPHLGHIFNPLHSRFDIFSSYNSPFPIFAHRTIIFIRSYERVIPYCPTTETLTIHCIWFIYYNHHSLLQKGHSVLIITTLLGCSLLTNNEYSVGNTVSDHFLSFTFVAQHFVHSFICISTSCTCYSIFRVTLLYPN